MRNINTLAALSAALLMGNGAFAKDKPDQPKPRKICRSIEEPGRITPRKICRIVAPSETAADDAPRPSGDYRDAEKGRD